MRIDAIQLKQQNRLITDYINQQDTLTSFVDYPTIDLEKRLTDLQKQSFKREALAKVLYEMNKKWKAPSQTLDNIERLKEKNSVVVIGGQQAGLLIGPLYTMNKIISLIQYSRKQEEKLGVPVIPVFWIAGEDHDFAEINHVHMLRDEKLHKVTIGQRVKERTPVSHIELDHKRAYQWLQKLFLSLPETIHTKRIYDQLNNCLQQSHTYVDFFAKLIFLLFKTEGIVLINSGDSQLRQIEKDYFLSLIEQQQSLSRAIYETDLRLKRLGYTTPVDVTLEDAHLFYHFKGERILLTRTEEGDWIGKQHNVKLSTEDLRQIAKNEPELLSNNVMTRPLMQEWLFPTLAFIGGHAEIGYWMLLKDAMHIIGKKLPPLVPRLSITYINQQTEKILNNYNLSASYIINYGIHEDKMNYIAATKGPALDLMFEQLNRTLQYVHEPIQKVAYEIRDDVGQYADRNLFHLQTTVHDLKRRMEQAIEEKHKKTIAHFNFLQQFLQPENSLQERVWNVLPLLNEYGETWIHQLAKESYSFTGDHFIVYL